MSAGSPLDEATLRLVRDREPRAMNRFFDAYYDRVRAYVMHLLRDASTADDLAQDAFLRLHRALDRLDPARDPTPWVFTIVTNVVRDYWRSRSYRSAGRQVSIDEAWELPAPHEAAAPDRRVERREAAGAIRLALARLSPADREILLLRAYQQLETAEVVEVLGISPEAARQRYSRAVKRLGVVYRDLSGTDRVSQ